MNRSTHLALLLIALLALSNCRSKKSPLFSLVPSSQTNIHFNNLLDETEEVNVNTYMNIYTGAGVAAGDINNDGLTDLFFSGNQVTSRLYLNKGNLTFEDITESAGVLNTDWGTGAVMADVNQDGWLDVFMCVSGKSVDNNNLLFINNKDNTFRESSKQYGLVDKRQAMHAAFFDYDKDGDLDLFIITNPASYENKVNHLLPRKLNGESESKDILYRNNGNDTFTDISHEAGILIEGYSLGLAITDINNDQWPDIYISNDFVGNDILYVNNGDGTFTNQAATYFKHTSFAGMGNDAADINNDGLVDIIELDMRPEDNKRQKLIIPPTGYDKFQLSLKMGYEPQYTRNTLQLNQGNNTFSEVSFLAGISSTDWSWSPLLADYDNDGDKDLFITNGFLRDLGNMDFISYQNIYNTPLGTAQSKADKKLNTIKELEGASLQNYLYENNDHLQFIDRTEIWGIHEKGFSHGATYADLDNDGDLDLIVNNMNAEAFIYRNNSNLIFNRNFLQLEFIGSDKNRNGIGTSVTIYTQSKKQFIENYQSRGFEAAVGNVLHFGLDTVSIIDSLEVIWADGNQQKLFKVKANQLLQLYYKDATEKTSYLKKEVPTIFTVSLNTGITHQHKENTFVDFKVQPLLPHTHSKNGPGLTVGDVNKDGLDDFFVGGTSAYPGALYLQKPDGTFEESFSITNVNLADNMGVLFFDADGDGDDDLYVVSGGSEEIKESTSYQDHLYVNDGTGKFTMSVEALPGLIQSGSCVIAADYDHDGDLDLFIGGRIIPGEYPLPADSYLLRNDSDKTRCKFTNVTSSVAPKLLSLGMVTSGLWTDVDNDGWLDLMLVGEFMPITFFKNKEGKGFEKQESASLAKTTGWWNSITAGDFDRDGDIDYIAGNLGLNSRYKGTPEEPVCVYAKDYDKNGSIDPVMTHYLQGTKHIVHSRDELISQISVMKLRFNNYKDYAEATFENSFLESEIDDAYVTCAERFETSYIKNMGGGNFEIEALPIECQFAPVFGMVVHDFNEDGFLDALLTGNSYAPEGTTGRYDASVGVYLQGNGAGKFNPLSAIESGIYIDGDAKGLANLSDATGNGILLNGNNSSTIKTFVYKQHWNKVMVNNDDVYALLTLQDGNIFKQEFYFGSTYLSQSSRQLLIPSNVVSIKIFNNKGISHSVSLN
jgi:enediyne biosynthesis protein E4